MAGPGYDAAAGQLTDTDRRPASAVYQTLHATAARLAYVSDPAYRRLLAADATRDALALLALAGGGPRDLLTSVARAGRGFTTAELGPTIRERLGGARAADSPTPPGGIRLQPADADHIHSWPNPYTSCTCGAAPPPRPDTSYDNLGPSTSPYVQRTES